MLFTAAADNPQVAGLHLGYASSTNGFDFTRRDEPFMRPTGRRGDFDCADVEDTRITPLDGTFVIAYAGRSIKPYIVYAEQCVPIGMPNNHPTWTQVFRRVGLAVTEDFQSYEKLGPITSEFLSDANVILFPEKINGRYAMFHRPTPCSAGPFATYYTPGRLFLTFSDRLTEWVSNDDDVINRVPEDEHLLLDVEQDWERLKVGGAGVPIKTDEGWLSLYHAKDLAGDYRCGLFLLDREDPTKVLARTPQPVFVPEADYETSGRRANTIFPCAHLLVGDEVYIYYGASDEFIGVATVTLKDMLEEVLKHRIT